LTWNHGLSRNSFLVGIRKVSGHINFLHQSPQDQQATG